MARVLGTLLFGNITSMLITNPRIIDGAAIFTGETFTKCLGHICQTPPKATYISECLVSSSCAFQMLF